MLIVIFYRLPHAHMVVLVLVVLVVVVTHAEDQAWQQAAERSWKAKLNIPVVYTDFPTNSKHRTNKTRFAATSFSHTQD